MRLIGALDRGENRDKSCRTIKIRCRVPSLSWVNVCCIGASQCLPLTLSRASISPERFVEGAVGKSLPDTSTRGHLKGRSQGETRNVHVSSFADYRTYLSVDNDRDDASLHGPALRRGAAETNQVTEVTDEVRVVVDVRGVHRRGLWTFSHSSR